MSQEGMSKAQNFLDQKSLALFRLGFRPFFLFGALFAALAILVWSAIYSGQMSLTLAGVNPLSWHGHEMIYGFAAAIIAGFLLTASQNWSGIPGVKGLPLMTLVGFWVLARLLPFVPETPTLLFSIVDLVFIPLTAYFLFPYIWPQPHNRKILGILFLFWLGNLIFHMGLWKNSYELSLTGLYWGVDLVAGLILVIGGRVIPFFSSRALGTERVSSLPHLEKASVLFFSVFLFTGALGVLHLRAAAAVGLALTQLFVFVRWRPWESRSIPLLWILHSAYFWLIAGLGLIAYEIYSPQIGRLGLHTLAVGGIGLMILGMITRVSFGHSGRPLKADRTVVVTYLMLHLALFFRILPPLIAPETYVKWIPISGGFWALSFLLFFVRYFFILTTPRPDGRPG